MAREVPSKDIAFAKLQLSGSLAFKFFLACSVACYLTEWVIVACPNSAVFYHAQLGVLSISTFLFTLSLVFNSFCIPQTLEKLNLLTRIYVVMNEEVWFEATCLLLGWVFIFKYPGLATLRCLRGLRMLWYFELYLPPNFSRSLSSTSTPYSFLIFVHLSISYLRNLFFEFFTKRSKGGIIILAMFFYTTYIFSIVFSVEKGHIPTKDGYVCGSPRLCYLTLLRLSFYGGGGLDYLSALARSGTRDAVGFTFLLVLYMLFTALVLLNGLIGVFSHSSPRDSDIEREELLHSISSSTRSGKSTYHSLKLTYVIEHPLEI